MKTNTGKGLVSRKTSAVKRANRIQINFIVSVTTLKVLINILTSLYLIHTIVSMRTIPLCGNFRRFDRILPPAVCIQVCNCLHHQI